MRKSRKTGERVMMRTARVFLMMAALGTACSIAFGGEIEFELKLEKGRIAPGKQTNYSLVIPGEVPPPEPPFINHLDITYVRGSRTTVASVHIYRVAGSKEGSFTIGPVVFEYKGNTYRSNAVTLKVDTAATKETAAPAPEAAVFTAFEAPKTTVFVNERLQAALHVYGDPSELGRMKGGQIQGENIIIADEREKIKMVEHDGRSYKRVSHIAAVFAPAAGQYTIKVTPITVEGRPESRPLTLKTKPLAITVLPLPGEGRTGDFAGAIGDFSFELSPSTVEARPGDTVTLIMTITGPGNYATVSPPRMKTAAGIKQYEPRIVNKAEARITYEQVIRIESSDAKEISEILFTYFDPEAKKYVSLKQGPLPIRITGAAPVAAPKKEEKKAWVDMLKDVTHPLRKRGGPFYETPGFLFLEIVPILIVIVALIVFGMMEYLHAHPLYAASFVAARKAGKDLKKARSMMAKKDPRGFYTVVFRTLQHYLGTRRLRPVDGITSTIADEIDLRGIDKDVIDEIKELFYACHVARFTAAAPGGDDMRKTFDTLVQVVDRLNRKAEL